MVKHRLAQELGMTIEELEHRMSILELRRWEKYYESRPPAEVMICDQLASLQASLYRINGAENVTMQECQIKYHVDRSTPRDRVSKLREMMKATAEQQQKGKK